MALLTHPMFYDGVGYLVDAKRLYCVTPNGLMLLLNSLRIEYWGQRAYLWTTAIAVGYNVFGAGEWQYYTARFWPTLVYLL